MLKLVLLPALVFAASGLEPRSDKPGQSAGGKSPTPIQFHRPPPDADHTVSQVNQNGVIFKKSGIPVYQVCIEILSGVPEEVKNRINQELMFMCMRPSANGMDVTGELDCVGKENMALHYEYILYGPTGVATGVEYDGRVFDKQTGVIVGAPRSNTQLDTKTCVKKSK